MLRMLPRFALHLLAALVPLALAACADTLTSGGQPAASNAELQRDYDKTMTKTEQAAAISDLAQEKARQEQAVEQDDSAGAGTAAQAAPSKSAPLSKSIASSKSAASSKPAAPAAPSQQAY
jgi:hypothetical protein